MKLFNILKNKFLSILDPTPDNFRVLAIIPVHNDEIYLERCLQEVFAQGIEAYVIDNDSNNATKKILDKYTGKGIVKIEHYPHPGYFDWEGILKRIVSIAENSTADWIMYWCTDEIREPVSGFPTLRDAFYRVDKEGYNSINFDEFVFLPMDRSVDYRGKDYVSEMSDYFFIRPKHYDRLTAWKQTNKKLDAISFAGHRVFFDGLKIYPENFVLRHYLFLSWEHAINKYCTVNYSEKELARGWNKERSLLTSDNLKLPDADEVYQYKDNGVWIKDKPYKKYICFPDPEKQ